LFKVRVDKAEYLRLAGECIDRGYIGQGELVDRFEEELAKFLSVEPWQVVTVNSGTSAIQLALSLLGVGWSDEVICSPMTCMADPHAIRAVGADVVWCDVDAMTGLAFPLSVKTVYAPFAKCALVTDLGGSIPPVEGWGMPIVQDAAQNFGGVMWGDIVCYSFQAIKTLTTGDGGCLILRDKALADRARLQRWFGLDRTTSKDFRSEQNITLPGFKFHMTDLDAAMGLANLPGTRAAMDAWKENARYYQRVLPVEVKIPWQEGATYWTYMILVEDRKGFMGFMAEKGIHTSPVQSIGTKHDLFPKVRLPGAEWYGARNVAIPSGWWVTEEERSYIAECVMEFLK
jgi:dTDP-4-amino-4,6-dideoxygalactose transaminase